MRVTTSAKEFTLPISEFRTPGKILFGVGALELLGKETRALGRRALLVTGRSAMAQAGTTARCMSILAAAGVEAATFEEVAPEPDVTTVDRCREAVRRYGAEVVIGLGGGSAIDAAKAAAGLAREDDPTRAFHQGRKITRRGLPHIAVPSTSGTGAEMTNNAVISDRERNYKASIRDESLVPTVALVDPQVTVSSPPRVTAISGIDALVQAVESYLSRFATPMTEAISLRAGEEMVRALPAVVRRGDDLELRTAAAWASAMAGLALTNARLGVIHGIAHPVGVRFNVPHGLACGVLLPAALEFNREAVPEKYAALARLFGGDPAGYARGLLTACGLPARLTEYRLDPAVFETIAGEALPSGSTKANPRPVTRDDVIAMLHKIA
jgi:alcohol dehydrogenase class IV